MKVRNKKIIFGVNLVTIFCFLSQCLPGQPISIDGVWNSTSGKSFEVAETSSGIKFRSQTSLEWITAEYIGGNSYQSRFYWGNELSDIFTIHVIDNNRIETEYDNGNKSQWTKINNSKFPQAIQGSNPNILRIEQLKNQIYNLETKKNDAQQDLARFKKIMSTPSATSLMTEQSYLNYIEECEKWISIYRQEMSRLE